MLDEFRSTYITWDKATRRIYSPITANESDSNGRKLNIQVVNSGQVENLTGATLHLYWETKDKAQHGLDAFTASDISKGEFEIFYTTGMLSNIGELNATLVLVDSTGKVVSDWFKITVARGIDDDAIQSENSFSSLTQALTDISNLEQNYTPRLNDLTAQLQQKPNKDEARLKAQKIEPEDWSERAIALATGQGTINLLSVPQDGSVTGKKTTFMYSSKNLVRWDTRTLDKFVQSNAVLQDSTSYDVSDFIPVKPNTTYSLTPKLWGAYYKADKTPLYQGYGAVGSITTPADCYFVRMTMSKTRTANVFCEGDTLIPYEDPELEYINKPIVTNESVNDGEFTLAKFNNAELSDFINGNLYKESKLLQDLRNPHKKTTIKLYGDSITHGVGATGFSPTGETIPTLTDKRDLFNSVSWANLLRNYLNEHFNKDIAVSLGYDKEVERGTSTFLYNEGLLTSSNTISGRMIFKTTFTGTKIKIGYYKGNNGKFEVYIDGVLNTTIDTYASSQDINAFTEFIVSDGTHTVEVRETATRNASATSNLLVFTYVSMKKVVELINNGVSGYQSHAISKLLGNTTTTDDDYIFYMAGTNDRPHQVDAWRTYSVACWVSDWVKENRPKSQLIIMSANPCGGSDYTDPIYKFSMEYVDMVLRKACIEKGVPFISHYNLISEYLLRHEKPMSYITTDNVHPNDAGHKLMFDNILFKTGLAPKMNIA